MTYQDQTIKLSDIIIPKLQPIFNDKRYSNIIITSGRAGTKSSFGAILEIFNIISEENCSEVVLRKFHNKLKKTVYKEALRGINRLKINKSDFKITVSPMEIKYKENGNAIYFTGNDSIDDTKGMIDENKPIKIVAIDELTEFFDKGEGEDEIANIEATFIRGNDEDFRMFYFFNPPRNPKAEIMQWLDKMKQRPDTIHIHIDYRDVPIEWLGKKLIESAEILKNLDEKMYNWLWLGLCTGIDELIYYMFDEEKHVEELTEEHIDHMNYLCVGVDYGQMNATTYECFGIDEYDKILRGVDEYYYSGRDEGKQKSPSEYAKDFKEFKEKVQEETKTKNTPDGLKIRYVFIDPSAKGLAEEIKRVCPDVFIKDAENDVALGIMRVQKLLSYQRIRYSPKQKMLIQENYQYEYNKDLLDKGKEEPIKKHDHCEDAERYLVMGVWKIIRRMLPFINITEEGDTSAE